MAGKKAILAGASGLIGSNLLQQLLASPHNAEVLVLVRKEIPVSDPKLKQLVLNFDDLDKFAAEITGDAVFSCLGTTMKQTPDKVLYRKIDHDYPIRLAQLAHQNGVKQFHWVSSVGAYADSGNPYLKMKGETEVALKKVGVDALHLYQPSMLSGREEKTRLGEGLLNGLMTLINPLLFSNLRKYHSIPAVVVARAMLIQSIDNQTGIFIHQYNNIKQAT